MHLFTSCSSLPLTTSLYIRHIPKKKDKALYFLLDRIDDNTGWELYFVENWNSLRRDSDVCCFASTWNRICSFLDVYKDVQGAFGVAAYVARVMTLAVISWQMWAVWGFSERCLKTNSPGTYW